MIGFGQRESAGPGGAGVFTYGSLGPGSLAPGELLNQAQPVAAPTTKKGLFDIPPVIWMFVFLIVGYWGLHQSLKAV